MRWMALDVGSKTIGVAITDPLRMTARPLVTLKRQSLPRDSREIIEMAASLEVERLILGRPVHMDGTRSAILEVVEALASHIAKGSSLRIEWMDERLSTREADAILAEKGVAIKDRRKKRNEYAAAVILRRYLEEKE